MAKGAERRAIRRIARNPVMQISLKSLARWSMVAASPIITWRNYYTQGKQFALRDPLKKSDAIVVLAGARGNLNYLEGKIRTAVQLYQRGWAPCIITSGRFSVGISSTPHLIPREDIELAAAQGRIQSSDVERAATHGMKVLARLICATKLSRWVCQRKQS